MLYCLNLALNLGSIRNFPETKDLSTLSEVPSWPNISQQMSLPSDTKLLLTKNYFEIIIFEKLRISRVISGKSLSFPEILRGQIPSKITKNNSQGIIFVIISCQRVFKKCFGAINFENYKTITLHSQILGMLSCKEGRTSGSNITKRIVWWNLVL